MLEMLTNAVTGVNIIPTFLLGLVMLHWLIVMLGVFDFEFLEFEVDGAETAGLLSGVFAFLNVAGLPISLFVSIILLNFWILSMMVYYLPIEAGGMINGILLVPIFIVSVLFTKYETTPLKGVFAASTKQKRNKPIVFRTCTLRGALENDQIAQAEIRREGAPTIINVKAEYAGDSFAKGEVVIVMDKDPNVDVYYIIKYQGERR